MIPFDPDLNPAAILTALGITNATAITPVHGGADTALWRLEHGLTTYALRVFRREQVATYQRALVAMELAHRAHLPVPTVHATAFWYERPALLLSWCPGSLLGQTLQRHPWRVSALGRAFGRMQGRIHAVHAPTLRTQPHADWIAWAGPDEPRLQVTLHRTARTEAALLHLDYHPLNNASAWGRGRSPLASSSPVGLSTGVSSPARMSRALGTALRRSVVIQALTYLARFTLWVGVALVLWTTVGQTVAPTAPRVRLPYTRKGPRLSRVRVGIP